MSSLDQVILQLKENNNSQLETTRSVERLEKQFAMFINQGRTEKLKGLEAAREAARRTTGKVKNSFSPGAALSTKGGGLLKGLGIAGLGALAAIGASIANADKIKENVETLLSIGERYNEDSVKQFLQDGVVVVGLGALSKALIAFAIGSGANAATQVAIDKFGASDWAQNVADNVNTLLDIGTRFDVTSLKGLGDTAVAAAIPVYMGALAKGLIAFSAASVAGAGSTTIDKALGDWAELGPAGTNWAKSIKDNFETLLSIDVGTGLKERIATGIDVASITTYMGILSAGIIAFSAGQGAASISEAISSWAAFPDGNWAEGIKSNMATLLSIADLPEVNAESVGKTFGSLAVVAGGLALFGTGSAIGAGGQAVAQFAMVDLRKGIDMLLGNPVDGETSGLGANWAELTVKNVEELLKIGSMNFGDVAGFAGNMTAIAAGLAVFGFGSAAAAGGTALADVLAGVNLLVNGKTDGQGDDIGPGWVGKLSSEIKQLMAIDFSNSGAFKTGMQDLSTGLLAMFGANFVGSVSTAIGTVLDLFSSLFTGDKVGKTAFDRISEGVNQIHELGPDKLASLSSFGTALDKFFESFSRIANTDLRDNFAKNIAKTVEDIGFTLDVMPYLINGDVYDTGKGPYLKWFSKRGLIDFGAGLKGLKEEDLKVLQEGVIGLQQALFPNITPSTSQSPGGGGNTVVTADDNSIQNNSTPVVIPNGGSNNVHDSGNP